MFFMFFKLCKWYQIAQSISFVFPKWQHPITALLPAKSNLEMRQVDGYQAAKSVFITFLYKSEYEDHQQCHLYWWAVIFIVYCYDLWRTIKIFTVFLDFFSRCHIFTNYVFSFRSKHSWLFPRHCLPHATWKFLQI